MSGNSGNEKNTLSNNGTGLLLGRMKRLTTATQSSMQRQRLFRKLKDYYNADPENNDIALNHTNLTIY